MPMHKRHLVQLTFAALITMLAWLPSPVAGLSIEDQGGLRASSCSLTMDNPHYSSGAGGVIAKARVNCNFNGTGPMTIDLHRCTSSGHASSLGSSCVQVAGRTNDAYPFSANTQQTIYVPQVGKPGGPRGYWYRASVSLITSAGPFFASNVVYVG